MKIDNTPADQPGPRESLAGSRTMPGGENLIFRDCRIADFDQVCCLLAQLWSEPKLQKDEMREVFQKGLSSPHQRYLCVEQHNTLIGFCSLQIKNNLWQQGNLGYIDELIVDSAYRGKGIGQELLNRICQIAREKECKRIEPDSAHHRIAAHKFYQTNVFDNRALLFSKKL